MKITTHILGSQLPTNLAVKPKYNGWVVTFNITQKGHSGIIEAPALLLSLAMFLIFKKWLSLNSGIFL